VDGRPHLPLPARYGKPLLADADQIVACFDKLIFRDMIEVVSLETAGNHFNPIKQLFEFVLALGIAGEGSEIPQDQRRLIGNALVGCVPLRSKDGIGIDRVKPLARLRLVDHRMIMLLQFGQRHLHDAPRLLPVIRATIHSLTIGGFSKDVDRANALASPAIHPPETLEQGFERRGIAVDGVQIDVQTHLDDLGGDQGQRRAPLERNVGPTTSANAQLALMAVAKGISAV
jgi:hypothetical protein